MARLRASVKKGVPMIGVPDVGWTLDWYVSIGFRELGRYPDHGVVSWGMMSFGKVELMLMPVDKPAPDSVRLWFYTEKVDDLYELMKSRQIEAAQAALGGKPADRAGFEFVEDIYDPPYGGRQFSIRDPNGYQLVFLQQS
jgi:hypothetical protein